MWTSLLVPRNAELQTTRPHNSQPKSPLKPRSSALEEVWEEKLDEDGVSRQSGLMEAILADETTGSAGVFEETIGSVSKVAEKTLFAGVTGVTGRIKPLVGVAIVVVAGARVEDECFELTACDGLA